MQTPWIVVISDSRPVRESLHLLLSGDYDIVALASAECSTRTSELEAASLLIAHPSFNPPSQVTAPIIRIPEPGSGTAPLDPQGLRRRIARALKPHSERPAVPVMRYPLVPELVERLAQAGAATGLPILITGEVGTGKARLGRSLHGNGARFLMIEAESLGTATLLQALCPVEAAATLYVSDIADVTPHGRSILREILDTGGVWLGDDWAGLRLVAASSQSLAKLEDAFGSDRDLVQRLSAIPLHLPPLRERLADLPALVDVLARRLTGRPAQCTPAAMDRLRNYLWFGNLAELEAVITRSLLLAEGSTLDAAQLLFRMDQVGPTAGPGDPANEPPDARPTADLDAMELLIAELAHEFKNPMVVIKTAAQHLERSLDEQSGRKDMARMTGEAVERMDRVLENLLQFTRFQEPNRQDIALADLLTGCLSGLNAEFTERKLMLDYRVPARQVVHVDTLQVAYAIENLLRVVLRDLPPKSTVSIQPLLDNQGFAIRFRLGAHSVSQHLAAATDQEGNAETQALGFRLAQALIERNGGAIKVSNDDDRQLVAVELPGRRGVVDGDEEATRFDS